MIGAEVHGAFGGAERLDIPSGQAGSQTVDHWLITAPAFHPLWSQYVLCCVRLDDAPGFPPPHRQFDGATHELLVVALNPKDGPYATDDEMREVTGLAVWAVVNGHLNPETGDAPTSIREAWLASVTKTLAHIRGEAHAP